MILFVLFLPSASQNASESLMAQFVYVNVGLFLCAQIPPPSVVRGGQSTKKSVILPCRNVHLGIVQCMGMH